MVIGQDDDGNLTLGDRDEALELGSQSDSVADEIDMDDYDEAQMSECVICLEPFGLWDEVAWPNRAKGCKHVLHSECIRSWLLDPNHDDCPSCRAVILKPEEKEVVKPLPVNEQAESEALLEEGLLPVQKDNTDSIPTAESAPDSAGDGVIVILKGQDIVGAVAKDVSRNELPEVV